MVKQFRKHRSFEDGDLREIELHIRDHIDDLVQDGHSENEAFKIAVAQFGEIETMAEEQWSNRRSSRSLPILQLIQFQFKVAIRNLTNQPFYVAINIFGLAIGLMGALLIGLYLFDELSYDKAFVDGHRIYRINIDNKTNGEYSEYAAAPGPMAGVLMEDCPAVESVMRFREVGNTLIRNAQVKANVKEDKVVAADAGFFKMFGIQLLLGNEKSALQEPNSLVLSRSAAVLHFGTVSSALGQQMVLNDKDLYRVTGVIEDLPTRSFLRDYQCILSLNSFDDAQTVAWNTWYFPTFVKLQEQAQVESLNVFLGTVKDNYLIPWAMTFIPGLTVESSRAAERESGNFMRFSTTALPDIHLYSGDRNGEFNPNSDIQNVYIMSLIGVMLLLLASVNFINLSTSYSLKRTKEVGIRKVLGSNKIGIIRQFLLEAIIIAFIALVLALSVTFFILPYFNELAGKEIQLPIGEPQFWIALVSGTAILGMLAGLYPAVHLSSFGTIQALRGNGIKTPTSKFRNGLVIFQFAISVFLIISTLIIYQQVEYIRSKDLGFNKDQVIVLEDVQAAGDQAESIKTKIQQLSQVAAVSLSSYLPTPSERSSVTYFVEGDLLDDTFDNNKAMIIGQWEVDYDYLNTLGVDMIAGRNFSESYGSDDQSVIINETTAAMMGMKPQEVLGKRITTDFHRDDKENMEYLTVIGVVRNFHFESLRSDIDALTFILGGRPERMMIRLRNEDYANTIGDIKTIWEEMVASQPFSFYFLDHSFDDTFKAELRLGNVFLTFTILSIFIACLGLFGLATFNAERRTKEIGIRKVLGASIHQVTFQLTADFLKLVILAIVLAAPISYYFMDQWLQDYAFRIEMSWWTFAISGLIAVVISILTVGYQNVRSALMNPVKSLRSE